jgi:hypothetical protein
MISSAIAAIAERSTSGTPTAAIELPEARKALVVKVGIMRPPVPAIINSMTSIPIRDPVPAVSSPMPVNCTCIIQSPIQNTASGISSIRLRAFRAAGSGPITPRTNAGMNARSMPAATRGGNRVVKVIARRPTSHSSASAASGAPRSGDAPVQFGTAVSLNPANPAAAKP